MKGRRAGVLAAFVGLIALAVYLRTLAVSIAWGDSPELTAAAWRAGVPHPTGYPLYMLLGYAFTHLCPWGSVAQRMNLLSALSAAGAVSLVYLLAWRLTHARWASALSALSLAFSQTFWSQAVIAEVYAFHLLLMAGVLGLVLTWERRGERRYLRWAAVAYGLCCTHHLLSGLLLPGLLIVALGAKRRGQFVRELRWTVPLFLLPLCLYAYLPLAAWRDSPMNWGDPRTWDHFVAHITGRQYQGMMFQGPPRELWEHVKTYLGVGSGTHADRLPTQFGGLLCFAPLGIWSLARRRPRLFALTLLVYLVTLAYALNYYIFDVEAYYLPSHMMVALWIACGLRQAGAWLGLLWRRLRLAPARRGTVNAAFGAVLLLLPLSLLEANWSLNDHHDDRSAITYARAALAHLKPHALLLAGDDNYYFPLLYARYVENRRPDVILMGLFDPVIRPDCPRLLTRHQGEGLIVHLPAGAGGRPGGRGDNRVLQQLVADNLDRRPVYVLARPESLAVPWLAAVIAPYHPRGDSNVPALELARQPPRVAVVDPGPRQPARAAFGERRRDGSVAPGLELLSYAVQPRWQGGVPWLRVSYTWRVRDQPVARNARVWVVFTDGRGNYRHREDGSPEFHNIHSLAYGIGADHQPLPPTLRETYDLYVPPGEWRRQLQARIAVMRDERFLAAGARRDPWVELGDVPVVSAGDEPVRLASGYSTAASTPRMTSNRFSGVMR